LRQLGLAFSEYADDNNQTLPVTPRGYEICAWGGSIYPYVKSAGVFSCPDDTTTSRLNSHTGVTLQPVSYAYNANIATLSHTTEGIQGAVSVLNAPASTVLLYEVTASRNPGSQFYSYNVADLTTPGELGATISTFAPPNYSPMGLGLWAQSTVATFQQATGYTTRLGVSTTRQIFYNTMYYTGVYGRHSNGSNYLAADGHVKWLTCASVSTGYYFNPWTTPTVNEDSIGASLAPQAAGTESSQGWAMTFSPI